MHRVLAVTRRQLQNLEVFASGHARTVIPAQRIISHAKVAGWEHVAAILVVRERTRFSNQRIDHVTIVDGMFAHANQARHPLNFQVAVPDFDEVNVDHHVDPVSDQSAVHGIRVAFDLDRTTALDFDSTDARSIVQLL